MNTIKTYAEDVSTYDVLLVSFPGFLAAVGMVGNRQNVWVCPFDCSGGFGAFLILAGTVLGNPPPGYSPSRPFSGNRWSLGVFVSVDK